MAVAISRDLRNQLEPFRIHNLERTGVSLGVGAYGEVVEMMMNGNKVAVKKLHQHFMNTDGWEVALRKFEEECVRLSKVKHPNIVDFLGVYFEGNSNVPMLVMEFVPTSLRKHVENNECIGDERTRILLDICQGLDYLHELDPPLIHRDLTSNNVLLTDDLHAKIADLGTSKLLDHRTIQMLTNVPGNLSHMPPEAVMADEQAYLQSTAKAKKLDVFSFGNVLINVMTRKFPVVEGGKKYTSEVQRRKKYLDKIPDCKEKDIIIRCLNDNPDNRPSSSELVQYFKGAPLEDTGTLDDEEIAFVVKPSFDWKCPLCLELFVNPCQTSCCGNHICNACGNQLKNSRSNNNCPLCRETNFTLAPDKFFTRQVLSLQVECRNSKRGCTWTGELRDLNQHIEETCVKNFATCKHCSYKCPHKALPVHVQACPEVPLTCPNGCANKAVKRKDLKHHLEKVCALRVVEGGVMPSTANQSIQKIPLGVTMSNFSRHVRTGMPWYSPPFYTGKNGYKLCLRVDANWYSKGFVSVLVCVLKGENDKNLSWPLRAKFEVALYNWKTNKSLFKKILHLPGDNFCSANKTDRLPSWGKGLVEFIGHDSLSSDSAKYIEHDLLIFTIEKVIFLKAPVVPPLPGWAPRDKCFVVPLFQYMKQNDIIFYGPEIALNSKNGIYRLCSRVDANGCTTGKGSHVSVLCTLMKGEQDEALSWPIEADVVVEMLNWREDKTHKKHTISFNNGCNIKAISAVPIPGCAERCTGAPTLAAHSSLSYNVGTNTEYLNQDCLLFKLDGFMLYTDKVSSARLPAWVDAATGSLYPCFTLSEFAKRKEFCNVFISRPFFSHRNGYQMQIKVNAGEDQSIGLYLFLMKGSNDHQLIWPFQGDVVVEIVNWQRDRGHHSKIISLSPKCNNKVCDRVINGDRGIDSWGYADFISHKELSLNPISGIKYLQDDCLHFRVKEIAVHSAPTMHRVPGWQRTPPSCFQFTVNNFSKRKSLKSQYISPSFVSHRGGYKMRLEIKVSDSNNISLYVRLLKGENDSALVWPLVANIFVELLNWREDRNHSSYSIGFHERLPSEYSGRVQMGNSAANSWGTHSFISCNSLGYNHSSNSEYINSDCLCFRVKNVAVYSLSSVNKVPTWQPRDQPASFTISHFALRRSMNSMFFSPPFYAAKYKMCLKVYVNGHGAEKGKCISVLACLLKGEHDDTLEWPFRGDISVEVLNWHGDDSHFKKALPLDEYSSNSARVTTETIEPSGNGKLNFMPISKFYTYLSDQCMRMRVRSVVCYNNPLRAKVPSWQNSAFHGVWNPASLHSLLEFTVTNFPTRLANETIYRSEPFYTHKKGYKMRLEVDASGHISGYMSVYARLMAGEYDSSLKWPMKVDVSVELVNWAKNSDHIVRIIDFGRDRETCRRVSQEDQVSSANWGIYEFCAHSVLFSKKRRNVEYIQENCVRIRVKGAIIHSTKFLGVL